MLTRLMRLIVILTVIGGSIVLASAVQAARQSQPLPAAALSTTAATSLGVQFVQVATADNITGSATIVDHPLINNDPNAVIIATPNWNPGGVGGTYNNLTMSSFG